MKVQDRLQHAWDAFRYNKDPSANMPDEIGYYLGRGATARPDRHRLSFNTDKTLASSIYTRIATDAAQVRLEHVRLDENDGYQETINSGLNYILNTEANADQTGRAFIQDLVMSLVDEGVVAIVPVETSINPMVTGSYDILNVRVGRITAWFPKHVSVDIYNERTGLRQEITLEKSVVGIIEDPFYAVMNEKNSTLQRLTHKLQLLDAIDDQSGSGRLDVIVQLPYAVKGPAREEKAQKRVDDLQAQLKDSKYGVAYMDATEKVTQLNRPVENNLMKQVEYLTSMLYSQLGITDAIMDGTASEETMLNYYKRTIDVILQCIIDEFERKFLTKTGRTQGQAIRYYRNPFNLTPSKSLADIADKFTRNEILTSNEFRGVVGYKPSKDPGADELRNKNIGARPGEESPISDSGAVDDNNQNEGI